MNNSTRTLEIEGWFEKRGWTPFQFQRDAWAAYLRGESGLVEAATGLGKTAAVWLGPLQEWLTDYPGENAAPPLRALWITPLRALAADTLQALSAPAADLDIPWTIELRTGDTSSSLRKRQRTRLPSALIITPESLSLLLTYPETAGQMRTLKTVIIDEWHELLGTKRGVQTELCLSRLRRWVPDVRIWGLSATIGNLEVARDVLLGGGPGALISGEVQKPIHVETLIPPAIERFPWAGHMGLSGVPQVVERLAQAETTLLFTNTRNQAERWYQALTLYMPEWETSVALHHGSLGRAERERVEKAVAERKLRCVVCTSSLDLGVDFAPVDQVIQIGSPRGVARLIQRAGRSGHRPDGVSRVFCVPTNSMDLAEFAAVRSAAAERDIETRTPLRGSLDVLIQHLVTIAVGEGFRATEMRAEVMTTYAFSELSDNEWNWVLAFIEHGGEALSAYPQYARVKCEDGVHKIASPELARLHRMSIGTITSDSAVRVVFLRGADLGTVEESFLARLKPGDTFIFAGHRLELVMVKDMKAYVRKAARGSGIIPKWLGGKLPLSANLAHRVRETFAEAGRGELRDPEMQALAPLLDVQQDWSALPEVREILIERVETRDGHHLFIFPFEGRVVHEGLASLLAFRLTKISARTVTVSTTDAGFELLSPDSFEGILHPEAFDRLVSPERAIEDLMECMNVAEIVRRQFREIARIAGLVFTGYPGAGKTARQLQASSGLIFDVLVNYDAENLLIHQARREALQSQLEADRLVQSLVRLGSARIRITDPGRLTPFAFPIWAERIQAQVSSEKWLDRVKRMAVQLDHAVSPRPRTGRRGAS